MRAETNIRLSVKGVLIMMRRNELFSLFEIEQSEISGGVILSDKSDE